MGGYAQGLEAARKLLAGEPVESRLLVAVKSDDEQRVVLAEVYAPNDLDTQGDFMLPEDVRELAYAFLPALIRRGDLGIDVWHDERTGRAEIVESFIARKGDPDFVEGAWVLGVRVLDSGLWRAIKAGEYLGYSMQAVVLREPTEIEIEVDDEYRGETHPADGHTHDFQVTLDEHGRVIEGKTGMSQGHFHSIKRSGITETADGHVHRFDVRQHVVRVVG